MITYAQSIKLRANWGEKASSLACKAEVKLQYKDRPWECYIIAQNPENLDEVYVILHSPDIGSVHVMEHSLAFMLEGANYNGYELEQDHEFVPIKAAVLYRKLRGRYELK